MNYHNITHDDMKNGDGLRVVLWVAGCSHHCDKCQNPLTWDPDGGILFDEKAEREIYDQLSKKYIAGITFSGGDPLFDGNIAGVMALAEKIRRDFPEKTIWLYTGFTWEEVCRLPIMKLVDVVVDGEYIDGQRDVRLRWKGSRNQRVIDVQDTLKSGSICIHCPEY